MESDVCVICLEEDGKLFQFCQCCYLAHLNCLQSYMTYEAHNIKKCACGRKIDAGVIQKILKKKRKIDVMKRVPYLVLVIFAITLALLFICEITKSNDEIKSFSGWINYLCTTSFYIFSIVIYEIVNYSIFLANWVNTTAFPIIWNCIISASDCICIEFSTVSKWVVVIGKEVNNIILICYPFVTEWVIFTSRLITNGIISFYQTVLMLMTNNSTYLLAIAQFILQSLIYALENILRLILSTSKYSIDFIIEYGPILYNTLSSLVLDLINYFRYIIEFTAHWTLTLSPIVFEYVSSLFMLIFNWLIEVTQNVSYSVLYYGPKVYDSTSEIILKIIACVMEFSAFISTWVLEASQCISALVFIIGDISLKGFWYIEKVFKLISIDIVPVIVEYFIFCCQYIYNKLVFICQIFQHFFLEECIIMSGRILNYIYIGITGLTQTISYLIEEYCIILITYFYVILDYSKIIGTQTVLFVSNSIQWVYYILLTLSSYFLLFLKHSFSYAHCIVESSSNWITTLLFKIGYILYNCGHIFGFWVLSFIKITFDSMMIAVPPVFEWALLSSQLIYFWLLSIINVTFNCTYIVCKNTFSSIIYICDIATSNEVFSSKVLDLCSHITSKWLISIGQVITDWIISIFYISGNFVYTVIQFTFTSLTEIIYITINWIKLLLEITTKLFPIDYF